MGLWASKDTDEILDYVIYWSDPSPDLSRLEPGELLVASVFSVIQGDITITSSSFLPGGSTTVWLAGGTTRSRCRVLNTVTTNVGRVYDQTMILHIREH